MSDSVQSAMLVCPHCLEESVHWLPDQPMFTLVEALAVIPVPTRNALHNMDCLHNHYAAQLFGPLP
jgi:hypothetical protein